jgi:hypothetical protein
MASERPGPSTIGSDTWPGLSRLAAQAANVLEVSDKITSSGSGSGGGSGGDSGSGSHEDNDTWTSLRESMQNELGCLRAAIDYVIGQNGLDWEAVNRQRDRNRALYERRADESHGRRSRRG